MIWTMTNEYYICHLVDKISCQQSCRRLTTIQADRIKTGRAGHDLEVAGLPAYSYQVTSAGFYIFSLPHLSKQYYSSR
jgi:hypothetical protein